MLTPCGMRRRTTALAGAAVVVAAFFFLAPIVYSPTTVYGPLILKTYPTDPNWESLSCWALGYGVYYGRTTQWLTNSDGGQYPQYGNATQFGCPPSSSFVP